jgi:hypothetical protein
VPNITASRTPFQAPAFVVPRPVTPTPQPTPRSWSWSDLVAAEPRLLDVAEWATETEFSWSAYQALKARMRLLVGSKAQQPELRTRAAWDSVGQHLLDCMQGRAVLASAEGQR